MIQPRTLKGFRDFLPKEARKRQYVINTIKSVFELYGFEPLETPALEYADILKGKYGEEEKLIYEFQTRGGDTVALRYDQTVPLARAIIQYQSELTFPFKRYQIQNVWRGENTQKGRYREFLQCDADIIGTTSPLADAEILKLVLDIYSALQLNVTIKINDRANFENLDKKYVSAIDKLEKIGESAVLEELIQKGMENKEAEDALKTLQQKPKTQTIDEIYSNVTKLGGDVSKIQYEPTLARGLDYYTGMIFETIATGSSGSLCSGGRWDNLIEQFSGKSVPAVGFGLGFDRTLEVLEEQKKLHFFNSSSQVLVTIFSPELKDKAFEIAKDLRFRFIQTELWYDEQAKMEKQLKYANAKQIPYVVIVGPEEAEKNIITVKSMETREQKQMTVKELSETIKLNR